MDGTLTYSIVFIFHFSLFYIKEFIHSETEFLNITLRYENERDELYRTVSISLVVPILGFFILPYLNQAPGEDFRFSYENIELRVNSNMGSTFYCSVDSLDENSRWAFFERSSSRPLFFLKKNMIFTLKKMGLNLNMNEPQITEEYQDYTHVSEILSLNDRNLYICSVMERLIFNRNQNHDPDSVPFVFIDGSSGMGKTQIALTLLKTYSAELTDIPNNQNFEAFPRPQRKVLYFTFLNAPINTIQEIYKSFSPRSSLFRECLENDITTSGVTIENCTAYALSRKSLFIFGFIVHMLNESMFPDQDVAHGFTVPRRTAAEVSNFIRNQLGGVKPIVILDEYTVHGNEEIFARFARNALRALDIGVIVTGTDSKAVNLIDIVNPQSRRSDPPEFSPWCYVIGDLPPTDPQACNIPDDFPNLLLRIIQISRPWFAQLIAKKFRNLENRNLPFNELFNILISQVSEIVYRVKDVFKNDDGRFGQSRLFLGKSYIPDGKMLIHKHFAKIDGPLNFTITVDGKRCEIEHKRYIDNSEVWIPTICFPSLSEDCLLFILLSGYSRPAFAKIEPGSSIPVEYTYRSFFDSLQNSTSARRYQQDVDNPSQQVNSGMALESLCSVAIIVGSHFSGVQGTKISEFLKICMYHLSFWETLPSESFPTIEFPVEISSFSNFLVPFLSPPCQTWPEFLTDNPNSDPILFRNFVRSVNTDQIDLSVIDYEMTGEVKDWNKPIPVDEMAKILNNIKRTSRIHLVIVNELQQTYFKQTKLRLREYLIQKHNTSVTHLKFIESSCAFYRVKIPSKPLNMNMNMNNSLVCRQVVGLPTIPDNPTCLVLFIEIGIPQL